jgi:hypothetical protein
LGPVPTLVSKPRARASLDITGILCPLRRAGSAPGVARRSAALSDERLAPCRRRRGRRGNVMERRSAGDTVLGGASRSAGAAVSGSGPARPDVARSGRVWPRPTRGLGASGPLTRGPGSANAATVVSCISMNALRAHVENGRVVLDDPVDLPDGTVVEIEGLSVVDADDDFTPEERQKILRGIEQGLADIARGEYVDAEAFIDELLAES